MRKAGQQKKLKKLGLVLGGGGARGFAHIGVMKVLAQENITVDFIAGTSMGGIMGAMLASGLTPAAIEKEILQTSKLPGLLQLIDLSPAEIGMQSGKAVRHYFEKIFGKDRQFSDLAIPLGVVTVDLISGNEFVLKDGKLVDALRATSSLPGVFDPVQMRGAYYVDGGILNNVPVDVARQMGAQAIIAVDVIPAHYDVALVSKSSTPRRQRLSHTVDRTQAIMSGAMFAVRYENAMPDVMLRPDLPSELSLFSGLSHVPAAIEAGEQATRDALPAIKRALRRGRIFI